MDELKISIEALIINGKNGKVIYLIKIQKKAALYNLAKIGQIRNDLGETMFVLKNHKFFEDVLSYSYKKERNKVFHADEVIFQKIFNMIYKTEKELLPTLMVNKKDLRAEREVKGTVPYGLSPSFGGMEL
jgi:hypothetical protein